MTVATMGGMSELRTIRMNDGRTVVQPEGRSRYLVSRRLADWADEAEVIDGDPRGMVPLDAPEDDGVRNLADLSKADLVAFAEDQGLPTYGTKADIIARLSATPEVGANAEDEPLSESDSDGNS